MSRCVLAGAPCSARACEDSRSWCRRALDATSYRDRRASDRHERASEPSQRRRRRIARRRSLAAGAAKLAVHRCSGLELLVEVRIERRIPARPMGPIAFIRRNLISCVGRRRSCSRQNRASVFCVLSRLLVLAAAARRLRSFRLGAVGRAARGQARFEVLAAENFWGSIAAQLGGEKASVRSILVNPAHRPAQLPAPTAQDARAIAGAQDGDRQRRGLRRMGSAAARGRARSADAAC